MGVPGQITVDISRQHGTPGLLKLQKYHIIHAAALEKGHIRTQADATNPNHLVCYIDERVTAQHASPLKSHGAQIVVQSTGNALRLRVTDSRDQGRFINDVPATITFYREAWQRAVAGP